MFQLLVNTTNEKPSNVRRYILIVWHVNPNSETFTNLFCVAIGPATWVPDCDPYSLNFSCLDRISGNPPEWTRGSSGSPSPQGDAAAKRKATRRMSSQASMKSSGGSSGNWMIFGG